MPNTLDKTSIILEACVETLEQCINAEQKGAGRIELCDRLDLDGTTPPEELIRAAKKALNIPIRVMIRPRGGHFIYTAAELDQMRQSILLCQDIGVDGVVLGILDKNNELDLEAMRPLIELAKPLHVVIHKAIDDTPDTFASMQRLQSIKGVNAILTSGKAPSALTGAAVLRKMTEHQKDLRIIVAGGVTKDNINELHQLIGASQYHGKRIVGELF